MRVLFWNLKLGVLGYYWGGVIILLCELGFVLIGIILTLLLIP